MAETTSKVDTSDPGSTLNQEEKIRQGKAYVTEHYGVWDFLSMNEDYQRQLRRLFDDIPKSLPSLYQLIRDIYFLSPSLFLLFWVSRIWGDCQGAINLHFSSQLLRVAGALFIQRYSESLNISKD